MLHDDPTHDADGLDLGARSSPGRPFEVGDRIGGYRLLALLGRGGMSHVFEAEDTVLGRRVAIKVCDAPDLGATSLLLEARALASVRHAGLPVVHGLGVHRGWTYLVLERLYGIDLERHLDGPPPRRLEPAEGLPILAGVADVLAEVHRAGLAHRDLKPGNVMLCPGDRIVLLDFGIALPEVDAAYMVRCGTPRYLAPEIVRGELAPGGAHLVDVYAFGAVAFEMFAGRALFETDDLVEQLEHQIRTPAPDLGALRPDLPRELSSLVAACLAKVPTDRPGDMEAIAGDLRALARRRTSRTTAPLPAVIERKRPGRDVLIIEDDEDIRDGIAALLEARGFRTRVAANGREARALVAETGRRPTVILLDLMMPVMDGQAFLEQQAGDPTLEGVPVLLVTAQSATRALGFPSVRGVVPKPLAVSTLLRTLDELCRSG